MAGYHKGWGILLWKGKDLLSYLSFTEAQDFSSDFGVSRLVGRGSLAFLLPQVFCFSLSLNNVSRSSTILSRPVYIPHSSDQTFHGGWGGMRFFAVYIPHSSDQTHKRGSVPTPLSYFISHIVQIKPTILLRHGELLSQLYIPHSSDQTQNPPKKNKNV